MRDTGRPGRAAGRVVLLVAVGLAALAAAACATTGKGGGMPEWAFETPRPDATNTYFVGHSSIAGTAGEALDDATANLVASIVQYLGVKISVETSAEARASLDSYSASIAQTVKTEGAGRLAGFRILSRYVEEDKKSGRRTVYILAAYATADLEKEKARIAALFKEREDAVSKPEAEAKSLAQAGRAQDALMSYLQAAVAAAGTGVDNADVKLTRNLASARGVASRMRFIVDAEVRKIDSGQAFSSPLVARLVADDGMGGLAGVQGARLLVSYPRRQGARTTQKTEPATTDAKGLLAFTPPPPDFVGPARLQVRLDIQAAIDLLEGMPASRATEVAAIMDALRSLAVEIPYEVLSRARSVPTAILVVDLDEAGVAVQGGRTQSALADALTRSGFGLRPVGLPADQTLVSDDAGILAAAKSAGLAGGYQRLAYGRAQVTRVRKDGTGYIAEGKAQVKVVELSTGSVIYSGDRGGAAVGADEASARAALYRELGANAVGQDLLATLP